MKGLEPSRREAPDPKSGVYTNFTTSAQRAVKRDNILFTIKNNTKPNIKTPKEHIYFVQK